MNRIRIDRNAVVGARTWLNVNDKVGDFPAIHIGENAFLGLDNFITAGRSVSLGPYCLTAQGCAFIGASHIYNDPRKPYARTGVTTENNIVVGANCFFGHGAKVIGNVTIGHGCVIGADAVVRSDIPPFSLVVGSPAKVIKRYDFARSVWVAWPDEHYVEGPDENTYTDGLKAEFGYLVQPLAAAWSGMNQLN